MGILADFQELHLAHPRCLRRGSRSYRGGIVSHFLGVATRSRMLLIKGRKPRTVEGARRTTLRVAIVVAFVIAGSLLFAWFDATNENPTTMPTQAQPTSLILHILKVNWAVPGCEVSNVTTGGGTYSADTVFNESAHLTNRNLTSSCTISSATATPLEFTVQFDGLPVAIPPKGSLSLKVSVIGPAFASPTELNISLPSSD